MRRTNANIIVSGKYQRNLKPTFLQNHFPKLPLLVSSYCTTGYLLGFSFSGPPALCCLYSSDRAAPCCLSSSQGDLRRHGSLLHAEHFCCEESSEQGGCWRCRILQLHLLFLLLNHLLLLLHDCHRGCWTLHLHQGCPWGCWRSWGRRCPLSLVGASGRSPGAKFHKDFLILFNDTSYITSYKDFTWSLFRDFSISFHSFLVSEIFVRFEPF